jgi:hypothetical protein
LEIGDCAGKFVFCVVEWGIELRHARLCMRHLSDFRDIRHPRESAEASIPRARTTTGMEDLSDRICITTPDTMFLYKIINKSSVVR